MKSFFLILLFLFTIIGGFILFGYMHEKVHQGILEDYGIESQIEIGWKTGDLQTVYFDAANISEAQCNENCHLAHNINEVVGYHLQAFYLLIAIGLFICIILLSHVADVLKQLLEVARE